MLFGQCSLKILALNKKKGNDKLFQSKQAVSIVRNIIQNLIKQILKKQFIKLLHVYHSGSHYNGKFLK